MARCLRSEIQLYRRKGKENLKKLIKRKEGWRKEGASFPFFPIRSNLFVMNPDLQRLYDLYVRLTWSTDLQSHLDDTFNTVLELFYVDLLKYPAISNSNQYAGLYLFVIYNP